MRNINNKRALSPVIATVILVAVAITVAVAVAYWMGGIAGQYTKFEKIEIQSALCVYNSSSPKHWKITMMVKNTGTATATIDKVFLNGIEVNDYGDTAPPDEGEASVSFGSSGLTLPSGSSSTFYIYIDADEGGSDEGWESVSSGTTINIKLHSAGGMEYLKMVELV